MTAKPVMSDLAYGAIIGNIESLTEQDAMRIYHSMARQFGWAGTFFTREDAEVEWQQQTRTDENGDEPNEAPLPDEVWETITNTWEWRRGLNDILTERGWELVGLAVSEAIELSEAIEQGETE